MGGYLPYSGRWSLAEFATTMYQALYRKYRPRSFSDVAGQEHVTETLRRQLIIGRLAHAYLFVGTRGTGKTTCAKILSRAVNCVSPVDGDPCNKCPSCTGIENGSILDVLELDAASNNGVDSVRALRDEAIYSPAAVKKRVYIIDEVHMLSTAAFNALLKILEEPPEHLLFILATTELHKVPATILSRCQRFLFKRLSQPAIAERLKAIAAEEGFSITEEAADRLAALADGSMRDGISLFDQCASENVVDLQRVLDTIGLAGHQELLRLASGIADRDTGAALLVFSKLYDDGKDISAMLGELASLWRDLLVYILSSDTPLLSGSFSRNELSELSEKLSPERLFSCVEVVREASVSLSRGGSTKLSAEMAIMRMCDERLMDDVPALLARIARLEVEWNPANREPKAVETAEVTETTEPADTAGDIRSPEVMTVEPVDAAVDVRLPEAASPEVTATDDAAKTDWQAVLELLSGHAFVHALLSDIDKVQAEFSDNTLIIRTGDIFTAGSIESKTTLELLKEAVGKVCGRELHIKVEIAGSVSETRSVNKLDSLRNIPIVKFE